METVRGPRLLLVPTVLRGNALRATLPRRAAAPGIAHAPTVDGDRRRASKTVRSHGGPWERGMRSPRPAWPGRAGLPFPIKCFLCRRTFYMIKERILFILPLQGVVT